uniref:ATP synthase subunit a n=1 Tax=Phyllomimus sp. ZJZ-2017 TaxID=1945541 RepID=A0A1Q1MPD7_9ORTH|nr:ATP synthase F0 subunit 6 [Phyllomimus sp. ZJZ-2017]
MMTMSLFSVFDPSVSMIPLPLNWFSTFLGLLMIPLTFWFTPSRLTLFWNNTNEKLHYELNLLLKKNIGATSIFIPLFIFILCNNFLGLFPYIFTSSSHMSMTMSLALPLWLSFMMFGWIENTNHMFAHLMPQGTPPTLMPFMVCIESISNLIRPGTLAIRLAANMIAGHLLLTLLGSTGPYLSMLPMNMLILTQIALLCLEAAVSIIQAYVFTILITLYASDIN